MKQALRKKILEKRDSLTNEDISCKSNRIKAELFSLPSFKAAKMVCFFVSFNSEVNTHSMIKDALKLGKEVCVPIATDHKLILSKIKSFDELDRKNRYGIPEPSEVIEVSKDKVDLIAVPGTVFDLHKHRVGYGKGYYDGLLKGYNGVSVGICFELQVVDDVPKDEWDEKLDIVITEKRIIQ